MRGGSGARIVPSGFQPEYHQIRNPVNPDSDSTYFPCNGVDRHNRAISVGGVSLSPDIIQQLRAVNAKDFRQGEDIFREGDMPDDTMFFLLTGEVAILKNRPTGPVQITSVRPGSFFGEMALVAQRPRLATARVLSTSVRTAVITKDAFMKLCGKSPQFTFSLLKYGVSRLLAAEDKLQHLKEQMGVRG